MNLTNETPKRAGRKIITSHIHPPIPIRSHDWMAYRDGDDETGPFGYGTTEWEAVRDLMVNEEGCDEQTQPEAKKDEPQFQMCPVCKSTHRPTRCRWSKDGVDMGYCTDGWHYDDKPTSPAPEAWAPKDFCPICNAPEVDAMTPRTVYACGSSDYDQRPGTFSYGKDCKQVREYDPYASPKPPAVEDLISPDESNVTYWTQRIMDIYDEQGGFTDKDVEKVIRELLTTDTNLSHATAQLAEMQKRLDEASNAHDSADTCYRETQKSLDMVKDVAREVGWKDNTLMAFIRGLYEDISAERTAHEETQANLIASDAALASVKRAHEETKRQLEEANAHLEKRSDFMAQVYNLRKQLSAATARAKKAESQRMMAEIEVRDVVKLNEAHRARITELQQKLATINETSKP